MADIFYPGQTDYIDKLNTLAPFETGTWIPAVSGTTTAGVGTYTYNVGRYSKIGNTLTFSISMTWTAHTGTGSLLVNTLPIPSVNVANCITPVTLYYSGISATAATILTGYIDPNSSNINIRQVASSGVPAVVPMDTAGTLLISGTYFIS